jgi:hypothetical protein
VAYRRLTADEWLIGTESHNEKAPFGKPVSLHIHSFDTTATYGISPRVSISGTLPFLHGSHSRFYADGNRHEVTSGGLSDINATGRTWLWAPASHADGNIQVGLGVKAATGKHDVEDTYYGLGGTPSYPVDQSVQLGDGGWGVIFDTQAFHRLGNVGFLYGSGSYLASPRDTTELFQSPVGPYSKSKVSVPDVFSAKGGLAFAVWQRFGMSGTLGYRVDGIPQQDLFGASHGFRRPAIVQYLDPGLSVVRGSSTFQLNIPIRTAYNFRASDLDRQLGVPGGGDLANYLFFIGYTHRLGGRHAKTMASQPAASVGSASSSRGPAPCVDGKADPIH